MRGWGDVSDVGGAAGDTYLLLPLSSVPAFLLSDDEVCGPSLSSQLGTDTI